MLKLFNRPPASATPEGRRVYAIGDIHGHRDLLEALCARIAADDATRGPIRETDVILLGDLIDRGPDSAGVIRFAMKTTLPFARLTTIKGNHEALFLKILDGEIAQLAGWLHYGGCEMLESFGVDSVLLDDVEANAEAIVAEARRLVPAAIVAWLRALPIAIRIGDYYFVHAGVRPGIPLDEQFEEDALWIRDDFLDSTVDHGATIVHGHTVTPSVVDRRNRIGIDTGAYRSGRLTAVGLEGTERWFIEAR
jgi:serine/threonine protein phosphatase 1